MSVKLEPAVVGMKASVWQLLRPLPMKENIVIVPTWWTLALTPSYRRLLPIGGPTMGIYMLMF